MWHRVAEKPSVLRCLDVTPPANANIAFDHPAVDQSPSAHLHRPQTLLRRPLLDHRDTVRLRPGTPSLGASTSRSGENWRWPSALAIRFIRGSGPADVILLPKRSRQSPRDYSCVATCRFYVPAILSWSAASRPCGCARFGASSHRLPLPPASGRRTGTSSRPATACSTPCRAARRVTALSLKVL